MVVEIVGEEDSQVLSNVLFFFDIILEEFKEYRFGNWEVGNKLKIIILEVFVFEIWLLR